MTMDSGGERPDEADEQPTEEAERWYFNLPGGAWERQEEKNRELRQRVHDNLDTPTPRADPFSAPNKEKRGFFGRGKQQEEPEEHSTAGGTFRLAKGGPNAPEPRAEDVEDDGDWSTEPVVPLRRRPQDEAPLPLPSTEWTADDDGPGEDVLGSMRKWSTSSPGQPDANPRRDLSYIPPATPPRVSSWLTEDNGPESEVETPGEVALPAPPTAPATPVAASMVTRPCEPAALPR